MPVLNELQRRLVGDMLTHIDMFRMGKLGFFELVGSLEGALDAGEFGDSAFVQSWYDLWTPLEIVRAQVGDNVTNLEIEEELSMMSRFLEEGLGPR